jgi:hypothetical protein
MSTSAAIAELLSTKIPYNTIQMQRYVKHRTGKLRSESGISARVRELRKRGFDIKSFPAKGSTSWLYQVQ